MTRTYMPGMNKDLWKDDDSHGMFAGVYLQLMRHLNAEGDNDISLLLGFANDLDELKKEYESKYGSIEDPQFYWVLATANAHFLFKRGKDEPGNDRIQCVINSYMTALKKHLEYPSLCATDLEVAFNNMAVFLDEDSKKSLAEKRSLFTPLPWAHELAEQEDTIDGKRLYKVIDFMRNDEIYIHENAQNAPHYPLTISNAQKFFSHFLEESFEFNGIVKSIFILSGKYNPNGSSWADGFLYSKSLNDIVRWPKHEEFESHIRFVYRENDLPSITVG